MCDYLGSTPRIAKKKKKKKKKHTIISGEKAK
jgi:hypothetical protein